MGLCKFKTSEVERCVQHALNSKEWGMGWSQDTPQAALFFVHDQGIYVMSNGEPKDKENDETFVAYAKGCHAKNDPEFYEESRFLVGGDDFAETIPVNADWLNQCSQFQELHIRVNAKSMSIKFAKPKKIKA